MNKYILGLVTTLMIFTSVTGIAAEEREDIHASADLVQPLLPGMKAPVFTVRDVSGRPVR